MPEEGAADRTDDELIFLTLESVKNLGGSGNAERITDEIVDLLAAAQTKPVDEKGLKRVERARADALDVGALGVVRGGLYCLAPLGKRILAETTDADKTTALQEAWDEADDEKHRRARRGLSEDALHIEQWTVDGGEPKKKKTKEKGGHQQQQKELDPKREAAKYAREIRGWGSLIRGLIPWSATDDQDEWRLPKKTIDVCGNPQVAHPRKRDVRPSSLPLLTQAGDDRATTTTQGEARKSADDVRVLLYGEVLHAWRQLTDVRFRLMSMLPAMSIVAFIPLLLLASTDNNVAIVGGVLLAGLGLCLTHGLHIYEQRNDGLYNHMISRARRIEAELDVETGLMLGRPAPPHQRVSHGRATKWVFTSVKLAWIVVAGVLIAATLVDDGSDETITLKEFDQINVGHSRSTVATIVDGFGQLESESRQQGLLVERVRYEGDGGGLAVIVFEGGLVVSKEGSGLGYAPTQMRPVGSGFDTARDSDC